MEGSCTPLSTTSGICVNDKSDLVRANVLECHICMKPPTDPVATSCGHVFCWPCVYQLLQNQRKPCPVCGTNLTRYMNILPLYGAAGSTKAASSESVIPPSPSIPRMFFPRLAIMDGSGHESDPDTPGSVRAIRQIQLELHHERARNRSRFMATEQDKLHIEMNQLQRRHSELIQQENRTILDIARLQLQLAPAIHLLPAGWIDLAIVESVETEAPLNEASSPSVHSQ